MEDSYQLALRAKEAHEQADSQQAQELLYKAIQNTGPSPDSETLDTLAEICVTLGDNALAYTLYVQSIKANPYSNPQKYMSLAQLSSGLEAKQLYEAGISVLTNKLKETSDESELQALRSQLASAFAAIAELHMTDLW